ncbi:hypothetical protein [Vibrio vulnificus YJ016]|uniref:Uncharacterized protein n=1 Tax=Vibrio vulnificus (strain YJ016) TaxID=196600 RepID=Q7MJN9_VIBVY|nr:hypothetical protein [Vibrio vulnificus YJ016]
MNLSTAAYFRPQLYSQVTFSQQEIPILSSFADLISQNAIEVAQVYHVNYAKVRLSS